MYVFQRFPLGVEGAGIDRPADGELLYPLDEVCALPRRLLEGHLRRFGACSCLRVHVGEESRPHARARLSRSRFTYFCGGAHFLFTMAHFGVFLSRRCKNDTQQLGESGGYFPCMSVQEPTSLIPNEQSFRGVYIHLQLSAQGKKECEERTRKKAEKRKRKKQAAKSGNGAKQAKTTTDGAPGGGKGAGKGKGSSSSSSGGGSSGSDGGAEEEEFVYIPEADLAAAGGDGGSGFKNDGSFLEMMKKEVEKNGAAGGKPSVSAKGGGTAISAK